MISFLTYIKVIDYQFISFTVIMHILWCFTALNIHCSQTCRDLLLKLSGYHFTERGLISLKGKGEQRTFWLNGEDPKFRAIRQEARDRRRAENNGKNVKTSHMEGNGHYIITRSSLKNKNSIIRSPLPRCSSLESPKRLR